jgi:hypothetical protein
MSIDYSSFKYAKEGTKRKDNKVNRLRCKSAKLANLERNRYSIITNDMDRCYICHRPRTDLHEVFRGRNRKQSMKYGLVVPLCRECHYVIDNVRAESLKLEDKAKKIFIKKYGNERFLKEFM